MCGRPPERRKNASQWPNAGLYEPMSLATTRSSISTPIAASDGSSRSASVFDKMASFQPPAKCRERRRHLREDAPRRQRLREDVGPARRHREAELVGDPGHRLGHHLPVRDAAAFLHRGLDAHVGLEQCRPIGVGPHVEQGLAHAAGPVDEGAVAVERCPPIAHAGQCTQATGRRRRRRRSGGRETGAAELRPQGARRRRRLVGLAPWPAARPRDPPTAPRGHEARAARRRRRTPRRPRDPSSRPRAAARRAHRAWCGSW